jgi:hypothetical protein
MQWVRVVLSPTSTPAVLSAESVPFHCQQYTRAGCVPPVASSVHVQGVSLSIASSIHNLHMQGVSLYIASSIHVQGVSLSIASSIHVQGVSLSIASSIQYTRAGCVPFHC